MAFSMPYAAIFRRLLRFGNTPAVHFIALHSDEKYRQSWTARFKERAAYRQIAARRRAYGKAIARAKKSPPNLTGQAVPVL